MPALKIFHFLPTLATAGAEKFVIALAREQAREHDVTIVSLSEPTPDMFFKDTIPDSVRLVCMDKKPGADLLLPLKVLALLRQEKPDIVNTHLRSIYYTFPAQIVFRIPSFHTIHNMAEREVGRSYRKLLNIIFNRFGFTAVSISPRVLDSVKALYGSHHRLMIENGIDPHAPTDQLDETRAEIDKLKQKPETRVLINIGRLSKQKNQSMLIDAVHRLTAAGEDLCLLILGSFHEEADNLKAQVSKLGASNIHFLGTRNNISDFLACSDLFCLSSIHEGLPITLLEAMSMGTIAVCTPAGGIPDVIEDGKTGYLSSSFTGDSYVGALRRALAASGEQNEEMRRTMTRLFRDRYSIEHCAKRYLDAYATKLHDR